jgi:hypothetical protein
MLKLSRFFPLVDELSKVREEWPDEIDWAYHLSACLSPAGDGKTSVVPSLRKLAESYFNHLGLACMSLPPELRYECLELISDQVWNLSGKPTPDSSIRSTPNHDLIETVTILLREAKEGRKSSLKRVVHFVTYPFAVHALNSVQVEVRDIPVCPVTMQLFREDAKPRLGIKAQVGVTSELAHIIPSSLQSKVS